MAGVSRQIIGSFEDIGKDIIREVASVPKDVVGKALESLGTSTGAKKTQQANLPTGENKPQSNTPLDTIDKAGSTREKKLVARSALEYLASAQKGQGKEPSMWEKQQEEDKKKKETLEQQKQAQRASLKPVSSKRTKGDLYGAQAKKTAVENKNTRQD